MRKCIEVIVVVILAVVLSGCALIYKANSKPRMNLSVPIDTDIAVEEDKALVYFIRPNFAGYESHAAVYDDDKFIGFVPYKQKLPYVVEPGEYLFMVVSEVADFMKADLLPGKTYYVQVVPRMGAFRARYSLAPITKSQLDTEEVRKWINEARLIKNKDEAYNWATNNHESVLKKKKVYFQKWKAKPEDQQPLLKAVDGE